jgi:hypothetical protein
MSTGAEVLTRAAVEFCSAETMSNAATSNIPGAVLRIDARSELSAGAPSTPSESDGNDRRH